MKREFYHWHHIIPKHMGGTDDPSNLVKLTVAEHAEAHRKLWEEHGCEYDRIAWRFLSDQIPLQQAMYEAKVHGNKTRVLSEDTLKRMSDTKKGKKLTEAHKTAIGNGVRGVQRSDEYRKRMSIAKKGNNFWEGKKHSPETKEKMRMAALRRWELRKNGQDLPSN